jgi:hypothetical protein
MSLQELKGRILEDEAAVLKGTLEHTGSTVAGRMYATLQMQFISKYLTKKDYTILDFRFAQR